MSVMKSHNVLVIQTDNAKLLEILNRLVDDRTKQNCFLTDAFFERFYARPSDFKDVCCFWNAPNWGINWDVDIDELEIDREENTFTIRITTEPTAPIVFCKKLLEIYGADSVYLHIDFHQPDRDVVGTWTCRLKDVAEFPISKLAAIDEKIAEYYKQMFSIQS
jgi:hypothetical protein